ncbi:hypothetical protein CROQUDRAFT_717009 [Cronartium quercuum f. sp. fusiforme G11]|uniref:Uncharacterized protein n=1 Tax=Cronartium quercuum f. sp. fusiforme G11 TaxID=708437 RepID=A0A9P6T927_9BASI|nr:hypothetical protein CROQUDRAFT_717009 [Cronartium quercuum f. sp. fusiforme G11]
MATLSSHRRRLPSCKLRRVLSPSHRRCSSDHGPSTFVDLNQNVTPSTIKAVLRKTRSEGRLLKDLVLGTTPWTDGYMPITTESGFQSEDDDSSEFISLEACEDDTWTEIVIREKSIYKREELPAGSISNSGNRPTSPLKKYFTEKMLDPIQEVEDSRSYQNSIIDHKRSYSCGSIITDGGVFRNLGDLGLVEPPSSHRCRPWQQALQKGTPSKPYAQATGYLTSKSRSPQNSSSSHGSIDNYLNDKENHTKHVSRPGSPQPAPNPDWNSLRLEENTNETPTSIRIINEKESLEEESFNLKNLPRPDPFQPSSTPYLSHRTLTKDNRNISDFICSSTPESTLYSPISQAVSPISSSNDENQNYNLISDTKKSSIRDPIPSGLKFTTRLPLKTSTSSSNLQNLRYSTDSGKLIESGTHLNPKNQNFTYCNWKSKDLLNDQNSDENINDIENRPEVVMSGLMKLMNQTERRVSSL